MADETTSSGSALESQKRKETDHNDQKNCKKAKPAVDLTPRSIAAADFSANDFDDGASTSAVERQSLFQNQRRQKLLCSSATLDEEEEILPGFAEELNRDSTSRSPSSIDFFQKDSSHGHGYYASTTHTHIHLRTCL